MTKLSQLPDFDAAEYLHSEEDVAAYLNDILEANDAGLLAAALGDIARARGMSPEVRSLLLHRRVAEKLAANPVWRGHALSNLDRWRDADGAESPDRQEWRRLLDGAIEDVLAVLVDPGERGDRLRKASPFPGVLTEDERREIFRAWRKGEERGQEED